MKTDKIKIVQILNSFGIGGRENIVLQLCNSLSKEKFEIHLIIFSNENSSNINNLHKDVIVHNLGYQLNSLEGLNIVLIWFQLLFKLKNIIISINPKIVHSHLLFVWTFTAALALKIANLKTIFIHTVHTSGLYYSNKGFINNFRLTIEKVAFSLNKTILIAISDSIKQNLTLIFQNKYTIKKIYNGIDFESLYKLNINKNDLLVSQINNRICVVYVSRLDIGKNHLTLLKAWEKVVALNKNVVLLLVGEGFERTKIENFIEKNNLIENTILLGNRTDIFTILSQSHIAVFPSLFEGFPVSLIEKMAMNLPVIVSDINIFKEILVDKETALFFSKNDETDLFNQLYLMINNKSLRDKLASNGKSLIANFSSLKMIENYEKTYLQYC